MRFCIERIGKVRKADLDIRGITAIAGENNTGKSTIGKALYAVFNSFYRLHQQIKDTKTKMIAFTLNRFFRKDVHWFYDVSSIAGHIEAKPATYPAQEDYADFKGVLQQYAFPQVKTDLDTKADIPEKDIQALAEKILEIRNISDEEVYRRNLDLWLSREFAGEVMHIPLRDDEEAKIALTVKGEEIRVDLQNQSVRSIIRLMSMHTPAIYLDNPFVLDELSVMRVRESGRAVEIFTHRDHLAQCLRKKSNEGDVERVMGDILLDRRMEKILGKLDLACVGEVEMEDAEHNVFRFTEGAETKLNLSNISAGMKMFAIIKQLLRNGSLEDKGVLILDEPEIHLHPEWQILFAEVIVLLQKEYDVHILLTTHSPYFLQAIEVYSAKHRIADRCRYYLAENGDDGAVINDVTTQTNLIYDKLLRPFERLKVEQYGDD